jgi:hypothetical protein
MKANTTSLIFLAFAALLFLAATAPAHPTANDCLWAADAHGSKPAQQVLFTLDTAQAARRFTKAAFCTADVGLPK